MPPRSEDVDLVPSAQWKPGFHAAATHSGAQLQDSIAAQTRSIACEHAFGCRQGGHQRVGRPYRMGTDDSRYVSGRAFSLCELSSRGPRCVDRRRVARWKPGFQSLHPTYNGQSLWSGARVERTITSKQANSVVRFPRLTTTNTSGRAAVQASSTDWREASSIAAPEPGAMSSTRRKQNGKHS